MKKIIYSVLTALLLSGCLAPGYGERRGESREQQREEYRDRYGNQYRHERWHDEDVYRHEDGRWYSRRNNDWILRAEINLQ
jgi:hypothetical protein